MYGFYISDIQIYFTISLNLITVVMSTQNKWKLQTRSKS